MLCFRGIVALRHSDCHCDRNVMWCPQLWAGTVLVNGNVNVSYTRMTRVRWAVSYVPEGDIQMLKPKWPPGIHSILMNPEVLTETKDVSLFLISTWSAWWMTWSNYPTATMRDIARLQRLEGFIISWYAYSHLFGAIPKLYSKLRNDGTLPWW